MGNNLKYFYPISILKLLNILVSIFIRNKIALVAQENETRAFDAFDYPKKSY